MLAMTRCDVGRAMPAYEWCILYLSLQLLYQPRCLAHLLTDVEVHLERFR